MGEAQKEFIRRTKHARCFETLDMTLNILVERCSTHRQLVSRKRKQFFFEAEVMRSIGVGEEWKFDRGTLSIVEENIKLH